MQLYDSLTRTKQELPPPPGPVRMYVCGPTVYQRIHVGNARPYVVFQWLARWLEHQGYAVKVAENITDVNDKIYDAAAKDGTPSAELAEKATRWYLEDTDALGLDRPDAEPLASETIPEIVALTEELVDRGLAYESRGDVYFRVARFPEYGLLSGARLEDMVAQEPSDLKEDQRDFALWKATKPREDTSWPSPWGPGRPGWHIECSAMAEKHLGPEFEIHGGGLDLRFPHHENELAQSRGAGRRFARLWVHNGMVEFAEEKMSKSVGNVVSLRDALEQHGREALLFFFLGAHYRSPVEYSDDALEQARKQAEDFRTAFRVVERTAEPVPSWGELAATLDDDFNTPVALAILHAWRSAGERELLERGLSIFGLGVEEAGEAPTEV
ncbi:MAG: cysteine--tRNA ligase, partial [Gaiellaceae bacterium]